MRGAVDKADAESVVTEARRIGHGSCNLCRPRSVARIYAIVPLLRVARELVPAERLRSRLSEDLDSDEDSTSGVNWARLRAELA